MCGFPAQNSESFFLLKEHVLLLIGLSHLQILINTVISTAEVTHTLLIMTLLMLPLLLKPVENA